MQGWGKRFYNWEFTAAVQHELMPRVSLNVQYARRWYGNFRVYDDLAVSAADYDRFTIDGADRQSPAKQRRHADGIRSETDGPGDAEPATSPVLTTTAR